MDGSNGNHTDKVHVEPATDEVAQVKGHILQQLAERREPDASPDGRVELAKAGILHLLAVREMRLRRYQALAKLDPDHEFVKDVWADEDMAGQKILFRLLAPRIKAYLLDANLPRRDDALIENPYAPEHMTASEVAKALEAIKAGEHSENPAVNACVQALQALVDEHRIVDPHSHHITRFVQSEAAEGPHYRINDMGLSLTPFWSARPVSLATQALLERASASAAARRM